MHPSARTSWEDRSAWLTFASAVPPIGLQVTPIPEVHHFGPPGTPDQFAWKSFLLSVPAPIPNEFSSRAVDWHFGQEGIMVMLEPHPEDATSGHLDPAESATLRLRPVEAVLNGPGLWTGLTAFFDDIYGTRTPLTHQIHVGVDGLVVNPMTPMVGEGPGVAEPPGAKRRYGASSLWNVTQPGRVETFVDWIWLNGVHGPSRPRATLDRANDRLRRVRVA